MPYFQKKEKIISINNFRRQYKQKIEYFTIEKQKGILFDDIMLAYKNIDNMADIKKHLEKYDTEESRIYLKNISSYKKQIEKFKPNILFLSDAFWFDSNFIRQLSFKPNLVILT